MAGNLELWYSIKGKEFIVRGRLDSKEGLGCMEFFFVEKGPAADATDAPQLLGLMCNPVMKTFLNFSK
jgi:hypothetical protein